jgi:hypothetical protein
MLTALQRTRVGPFTIDHAIRGDTLPDRIEADLITPVDQIADAAEPTTG